ncbi:Rne/Rng family ribonuclease [Aquifex pyrophilus]
MKRECKSLDGYFVDIGLHKEAFLQEKNTCGKKLKIGDSVIVQLKREETELKGAKVTCKINLPGKYIVYFPTVKKLKISSKIKKYPYSRELAQFVKEHLRDNEGVIIRASALKASKEDILKELQELRNLWNEILKKSGKVSKGLLHEEIPGFAKVIRDYWGYIKEICVDNADVWKEISGIFGEEIREKLRFSKDFEKLLKNFSFYQLISRLFSKQVWLKNGGFIVIEETEAMVVVDVNSGEGCGESFEENALRTNLEAVEEVARQIKLRNLAGIIVIDLIEMRKEETKDYFLREVKKIFEREGLKVKVHGITSTGLLELTRKREGNSITEILGEECPCCRGRGKVKSSEFILYTIEKEIERHVGRKVEIRAHPRIVRNLREFLRRKKLNGLVSIKEVWEEEPDYYRLFFSDYS